MTIKVSCMHFSLMLIFVCVADLAIKFINRMAKKFPFADQLDTISLGNFSNYLSSYLIPNLYINSTGSDNFNTEEFVDLIISHFVEVIKLSFGNSESQHACIPRAIRRMINRDIMPRLASAIQTIRQSVSALNRIQKFVGSEKQTLVDHFTPIRGCVERLARQSFCGRCNRRIPPLCRGSCNALVRGCLSPVYSAFERDFRQLWNVSRAIISQLESTIREFHAEQGHILTSYSEAVRNRATRVCGIFKLSYILVVSVQ